MGSQQDPEVRGNAQRIDLSDAQKADLEELLIRYGNHIPDASRRHMWAHNLTLAIADTFASGLPELTVTERRILKVGEFAPEQL